LQKALPKVELLVVSIASPLLVGVYENKQRIEHFSMDGKASESLLPLLEKLLQTYDVISTIYVRSPGSYMAIKLTYIILKTIEITKGIPCYGCSGFALNNNAPIKAMGSLYFMKEKETIITKKLEQCVVASFVLPESIEMLPIDDISTPEYLLPAV
jgi:tRNA A37 threonylcarbamoyladenosine modification protein TsaB